ncbi:hypothetical protein BDD12DRAFT_859567 [Trichophaea hybrida]|nr:hypothetical protein BDD12DRAFT_859567 [Trichophaea hybrida]
MSTARDPVRQSSGYSGQSAQSRRKPSTDTYDHQNRTSQGRLLEVLSKGYYKNGECRSKAVKKRLITRRDDMLKENGHKSADEGFEPVFFPEACVEEVLSKEVVEWVLGCDCRRCVTDAKYPLHCHDDRTLYLEPIMSKTKETLKLFAVLIHIDHPALISGLLNLDEDDRSMAYRHSNELGKMEKYWPNLREGESGGGMDQIGLPEAEANGIVEAFLTARHLFLLPTIDSDSFVTFDDNRVLPLINQRQITKAKGNFGSVYSFQFYPGYLTLKGFSRKAKLARKEVSRHDGPVVNKEVNVLMTISRRLEHNKHFIKLLKPYQIGDKINFIFPLANGDLREYLYDGKQWKHLFNRHEPPFKNSIWSQMVGLLTALDEYQSPKDDPIERRYHSDLKPRNILVFEEENDDVLVITDFGQAHIGKKVDPQGTTVTGQRPGTEAYAPPESHQKSTMNTKFDVWSMGCILLEVLVYVVQGPERVRELYEARDTGHGTDYYCCWDEDNRKYIINPGAIQIVGELLRNYATDIFILEVWGVILSMLQVDSRERSTSGKACQALKMAIDGARIRAELELIDWSANRNFGGSARTSINHSYPVHASGLGLRRVSTGEDRKLYPVLSGPSSSWISREDYAQSGNFCESPDIFEGPDSTWEERARWKQYTRTTDSSSRVTDFSHFSTPPYDTSQPSIPETPKTANTSEQSQVFGLKPQHRLAVDPFKQYSDEKRLIKKRLLEFSHLGSDFQHGTVQITQSEDPEKGLRVVAQFESGDYAPSETGALGSLKLIPAYAFENPNDNNEKKYIINFEGPIRYNFRFNQKNDAYICQGTLMGQKISLSLPVDVTIRSTSKGREPSLGRCIIQLWTESSTKQIRTERPSTRIGHSQTIQTDAPPWHISRVVIFPGVAKSSGHFYFISIPLLDDGDDFTGERGPQSPSFTIKRRGGAKINCYEISAASTQPGRYPAIAISFNRVLFDQQEASKGTTPNVQDYKCKSVYLNFDKDAERNTFASSYDGLKKKYRV